MREKSLKTFKFLNSFITMPKTTLTKKFNSINEIDLNKWKSYQNILTDSLWLLEKRDSSGVHTSEYHGNFIPQIPNQAILRFTKKKDWVVDTFLGSGTSLIECKRLGRNGIGIELNEKISENAKKLIAKEKNPFSIKTEVICANSMEKEITEKVKSLLPNRKCQLLIMHPPYWNIIKFSNKKDDLSCAKTKEQFLKNFAKVVENFSSLLEEKRFLVLVIGDKYEKGEWVPLGFLCMNEVLKFNFKLKSICIKDIQENRGKRNQYHLWRYRALKDNYYIFKHEYIIFFEKNKKYCTRFVQKIKNH